MKVGAGRDAEGCTLTGDSGGLVGSGSGGAPQAAVSAKAPTTRGIWRVWGNTRQW
ncbi:hypothetical protein GCM10010168_41470 [Actinoplanes ianthinogenes]|uniref:Uncharacterized protein n=1 Tax=Actinoplanes ianthinogenes TaxID=122358 RepID=A0ABM7LW27_9ACTN|nr:hypothetical protein Aiant_42000 [Actinoplanes ianthinogenes]GGR19343.1 hypothetical protein GCM10010168_41470 [Actinoplanes ianthinogenes]